MPNYSWPPAERPRRSEIKLRLTEQEMADLHARAALAKRSTPEYLRLLVLGEIAFEQPEGADSGMTQNERGSRANGNPETNPFLRKHKEQQAALADLTDGYAWQRWAREQKISPEVGKAHRTDVRTAKFVLTMISTYTYADGSADPSQDTLMRQLGCGARTLRRALDALEAAGLISIREEPQGPRSAHGQKPHESLLADPHRPQSWPPATHDFRPR